MIRGLVERPRQMTGNEVLDLVQAETGDEDMAQEVARQYVHQQKVIEAYKQAERS